MSSNDSFTTIEPPGTTPKITSIFDFSAEALGQLKLYLEQAGLAIGINQIVGFQQFTARYANVDTSEATTSTTFTDLATVGPELTNLARGKYVVLYGVQALPSVTSPAIASVTTTSAGVVTAAVDADSLVLGALNSQQTTTRALTKTFTTDNSSIKVQYRSLDASSVSYQRRWIIVLRYANP